MKRSLTMAVVAFGSVWMSTIGGCNVLPLFSVDVPLGTGLGTFDVVAGETSRSSGQANFNPEVELGRGTIALDPSTISFAPAGAGKYQLAAQDATTTITVSVYIADLDQEETVFDDGDMYGPFEVTFNSDFSSVSVDPSTVNLTPRTVDLLNSGMFSIGLEIESEVDGTLVIGTLTFNVGI